MARKGTSWIDWRWVDWYGWVAVRVHISLTGSFMCGAESAEETSIVFLVLLNTQSLIMWSPDPHAKHNLLALRQLRFVCLFFLQKLYIICWGGGPNDLLADLSLLNWVEFPSPSYSKGLFLALFYIGPLFFSSSPRSISQARVWTLEYIFNCCCWLSTTLWSTPIRLSFNLSESLREVLGLSGFPRLSISKLVKDVG